MPEPALQIKIDIEVEFSFVQSIDLAQTLFSVIELLQDALDDSPEVPSHMEALVTAHKSTLGDEAEQDQSSMRTSAQQQHELRDAHLRPFYSALSWQKIPEPVSCIPRGTSRPDSSQR